ncbi:MAG: DUF2461 domain-containing protein [Acidimicrobiales bacterium]|nr:DUF2461 domain-containing protein [Acidimicrobiales bacterium]
MGPGFSGFPRAALAFLDGLEHDNSKAFMDAHRDEYRDGLLEPARAFVVALGDWLHDHGSPGIVADPAVNGSLFRLNRDTRFTHDKSPYKTNVGMLFWKGRSKKTSPCLYVGFDARTVTVGGGLFPFPDVDRWRRALADDATGEAFVAAVERCEAAARRSQGARFEIGGPALKRVPAPFPADHPRGAWLTRKGLTVTQVRSTPQDFHRAAFVDWCGTRLAPYTDLVDWFADHVT